MAVNIPTSSPLDEVLDFLVSSPSPEQILSLQPSEAAQARLRDLLDISRNNALTDMERVELDSAMQLEHLIRRLKLRAREIIADGIFAVRLKDV